MKNNLSIFLQDFIDGTRSYFKVDVFNFNKASDKQLIEFENEVNRIYKIKLPKEYLEFLRFINGISYESTSIYGINAILDIELNIRIVSALDSNAEWKFCSTKDFFPDNLFLIGENHFDLFFYNCNSCNYIIIDKASESLEEIRLTLDSLEDIIRIVLKHELGDSYL